MTVVRMDSDKPLPRPPPLQEQQFQSSTTQQPYTQTSVPSMQRPPSHRKSVPLRSTDSATQSTEPFSDTFQPQTQQHMQSGVESRRQNDIPESLRVGGPSAQHERANTPNYDPSPLRSDIFGDMPSQDQGQSVWNAPPSVSTHSTGSYQPQSSTNPFLRSQNTGRSNEENSTSVWEDHVAPQETANPRPVDYTIEDLSHQASKMSMQDPFASLPNPSNRTSLQEPSHLIGPHQSTPAVSLTTASPPTPNFPPLQSMSPTSYSTEQKSPPRDSMGTISSVVSSQAGRSDSTSSVGWDPGADISTFDAFTSRGHGLPSVEEGSELKHVTRTWEEQQVWESAERERRELEATAAAEKAQREERERRAEEEWFKGEQEALREAGSPTIPSTKAIGKQPLSSNAMAELAFPSTEHDKPSNLPPRGANNSPEPPMQAPRPPVSTDVGNATSTSTAKSSSQRKETYQIKQIDWYDVTSPKNPRRSPILVQNLNGPCPLLALVNALILSTPADAKTALTETLRLREQVSLGLLLDAVFDELMSGRRGDAAQELPDVSELYSFLVTLHTGMNVNPRFQRPRKPSPNLIDMDPDQPLDSSETQDEPDQPGTFEETKEMKLYSTFSVPLIHGWLPAIRDRAHGALMRSAATYEDAQNLMFREEELEDKLQGQGLSHDEQLLLEDISTIKYFLTQSATQLTTFGLDVIQASMKPGSIAILFRNDHFSTLYKHPQSGQLLQLITDAGYMTHDEIVWESLVDVNGERSEFFSGDFRPVGNHATSSQANNDHSNHLDDEEGWTTVERSSGKGKAASRNAQTLAQSANGGSSSAAQQAATLSSTTEQEDHDLALAMQLQEEEEDRNRREAEARRREEDLSRNYLSSQAPVTQDPPSAARGRRSNRARTQDIRPLVPPRNNGPPAVNRASNVDEGGEAPPPTYEQAANGPPYIPPDVQAAPAIATSGGSAYAQNSGQFVLPQTSAQSGFSRRAFQRQQNSSNGGIPHQSSRRRQSYTTATTPEASAGTQNEERCSLM